MNARQKDAMKHADVLGAGATKRHKLPPSERGAVIWSEFERGTLYSGSGRKVTKASQARAIIHSETKKKEK